MRIEADGVEVKVTKKRIRNMHLYVKPPDGRVEVSAPFYLLDGEIAAFVRSKAEWIARQRKKVLAMKRPVKQNYSDGEIIYVWGKQYRLSLVTGRKRSLTLREDAAVLTMREGDTPAKLEKYVNEWYREALKESIERLLPKWEQLTGLRPSGWQTKNMSTRWGTCNVKTGKLWFNLQLAKYQPDCLEYIILHELMHLKDKHHDKRFYSLLDLYMPNWREVRRKLNGPVNIG